MYFKSRKNWKPVPYTAEERAENARHEAEERERDEAEWGADAAALKAIHPAFRAIAPYVNARDDLSFDNAGCTAFVLEQVVKIGRKAPEALKPELRAIYADIKARGGDAYAKHKARLQEINK